MADNLEIFKVYCEGGLNNNKDLLSQGELQPGSALRLVNYEPSLSGGYRRITGYENAYPNLPGTGSVLGVCVADGLHDGIFACRAPSSGSDYLYYWDTASEAWVSIASTGSPTLTGVEKVRISNYNWYGARMILTDGVNPAAIYDGTSYAQITATNAPADPKYATEFSSHMFLAGDSAEPQNLFFSAPLDETDFSPASGAGVINVGFDIVQIKSFRDSLYVFGLNRIKRLTGSSIADFQLLDVTTNLGCVASDSIVEISGDLLFLGPDGLRPISATQRIGDVELETVSKSIQTLIADAIKYVDIDKATSVVIRGKSQFRMFFNDVEEESGIIGGLRAGSDGQVRFEFGQLYGMSASCADSGYIGKNEYVIHGDKDGYVYRQEQGNTLGGQQMFSLYQTPYFHMGDPEMRKNFLKVSTYMRTESTSKIAMGLIYDYEDQHTTNPANYSLDTTGKASSYNEFEDVAYGDNAVIYDGNPSPVLKTNVAGSGTSVSLKYVTYDSNASHTIQGIVLLFGVNDRR